ncbi:MAG TPA: hypothetical protein VGG29_03010 [Caulobacteraceae bacterium]
MAVSPREPGTGFYLSMALVAVAIVFVGFSPSFYLKDVLHGRPALTPLTAAHGVVFTAFMILVVAQISLIGAHRPALHRQLGILGAMLFGAMTVLGLAVAIAAVRGVPSLPGLPPPLALISGSVLGIIGLAVLVALALLMRARSDYHQRLMLSTVLLITVPAAHRIILRAHLPLNSAQASLFVADALLAAAVAYDLLLRRRLHPAWLWAAAVYAAVHIGTTWAYTAPPLWMAFARWLTGI